MKDYINELAKFSVELRYDDLSLSVRTAVKNVIKDTVAAMAAGSRLPTKTVQHSHSGPLGPAFLEPYVGTDWHRAPGRVEPEAP